MANPFQTKFDSKCQECGRDVLQGDDMYAVDGSFVCHDCAEEAGCVCDCGNFKKEEYDMCYDCSSRSFKNSPKIEEKEAWDCWEQDAKQDVKKEIEKPFEPPF